MSTATTKEKTLLRLVVCLFPDVCALDFVGPMELLSFLFPAYVDAGFGTFSHTVEVTYASISKNPVRTGSALTILPDKSYDEATEQFDVVLVPGGADQTSIHAVIY